MLNVVKLLLIGRGAEHKTGKREVAGVCLAFLAYLVLIYVHGDNPRAWAAAQFLAPFVVPAAGAAWFADWKTRQNATSKQDQPGSR